MFSSKNGEIKANKNNEQKPSKKYILTDGEQN